jgi:hypothetical protein
MHVNLGAYPTDAYYDPNRPSWLPYWLDTPTESIRKYTGYSPSVQDLQNQQVEEIAKTDPAAAAALVKQLADQQAAANAKPTFIQTYGQILLVGGAILGTVFVLKGRS